MANSIVVSGHRQNRICEFPSPIAFAPPENWRGWLLGSTPERFVGYPTKNTDKSGQSLERKGITDFHLEHIMIGRTASDLTARPFRDSDPFLQCRSDSGTVAPVRERLFNLSAREACSGSMHAQTNSDVSGLILTRQCSASGQRALLLLSEWPRTSVTNQLRAPVDDTSSRNKPGLCHPQRGDMRAGSSRGRIPAQTDFVAFLLRVSLAPEIRRRVDRHRDALPGIAEMRDRLTIEEEKTP